MHHHWRAAGLILSGGINHSAYDPRKANQHIKKSTCSLVVAGGIGGSSLTISHASSATGERQFEDHSSSWLGGEKKCFPDAEAAGGRPPGGGGVGGPPPPRGVRDLVGDGTTAYY